MTIYIYKISNGIRIYSVIIQVAIDARTITKVTAAPMLTALPSFLDTPKNGQRPRNLTSMKLLIRAIPMNIEKRLFIFYQSYSPE